MLVLFGPLINYYVQKVHNGSRVLNQNSTTKGVGFTGFLGRIGADWAKTVQNTVQSHHQTRPKSAENGGLCKSREKSEKIYKN